MLKCQYVSSGSSLPLVKGVGIIPNPKPEYVRVLMPVGMAGRLDRGINIRPSRQSSHHAT
jgi:hypothetical protein